MTKDQGKIRPSDEHIRLQTFLMDETPRNIALVQSGIVYFSNGFAIGFSLVEKLRAIIKPYLMKVNKNKSLEDIFKEMIKDEVIKPYHVKFLRAAEALEKYLIMATGMTPGRQSIQKALIKTLESGKIFYTVSEKGGFMPGTRDPSARRDGPEER